MLLLVPLDFHGEHTLDLLCEIVPLGRALEPCLLCHGTYLINSLRDMDDPEPADLLERDENLTFFSQALESGC